MLHRLNKTRAAKEGVIEPSAADLIRPFVAGPDTPPRYSLHFGTINKVGVNPNSEYDTPLAVCAYPLTQEIFDQFLRIGLPFAQKDAKYLFVLEIKPDARVFYSTKRLFKRGVGPEYLGADLSKIEIYAEDGTTIAEVRRSPFSKKFFYSTRPSGYYQKQAYFAESGTVSRAAQWGRKLWKMGIDVWVDADNEGILHPGEPSQVMFFNPSSYRVVLALDNPKNTLEARFGRDWRRLEGIDLTRAYLEGADLTRANLIRAILTEAILFRADLERANLTGADLTGANLTFANLIRAILIRAILERAKLTRADLTGADLTGAYLEGADLTKADLSDANLTGANLTRVYLGDVRYDDSTIWPDSVRDVLRVWRGDKYLTKADLSDAELFDADLSGANLTGANLTGANLNRADLTDAILTGADLTSADLYGAKLNGAVLDGIIYNDSTVWPYGFTPPPSAPRPNRR